MGGKNVEVGLKLRKVENPVLHHITNLEEKDTPTAHSNQILFCSLLQSNQQKCWVPVDMSLLSLHTAELHHIQSNMMQLLISKHPIHLVADE